MINNELKRTLNVLNFLTSDDAINIIMNPSTQIEPEYLDPFIEELNIQLLTIESLVQKRSLIKLYIFEFRHIQELYIEYKEILLKKNGYLFEISSVEYEYENYEGDRRKLSLIENYIVNSYELFRLTFDFIQLCCIREQIDFIELCNELNFALDFIDISSTNDYKNSNNINLENVSSNSNDLKAIFTDHNFFELPLVNDLTLNGREMLFQFIYGNKLPYRIAMIDYLGFIDHLSKKYFNSNKSKLNIALSKWFGSDKEGRSVKGNINVLTNSNTLEPMDRYTSHLHVEKVKKDYKSIKLGVLPDTCP